MALASVAVDLRFLCFPSSGKFSAGNQCAWVLGAEVGIDGFSLYWYAVGVQVFKVVYLWIFCVCMAFVSVVRF